MNPSTRRETHPVPGWGYTAFTTILSEPTATHERLTIESFLGSGWLLEDGRLEPIASLDLFLELQRESRIPDTLL